jgi:site-specific recombinase XerD
LIGGEDVMAISIIQGLLNLGSLPSFHGGKIDVADRYQIRVIDYQKPHVVNKFPLLFSDEHTEACLELNLFLECRYKGKFLKPQKGGQKNLLGGVTVKTIRSIANSLKVFLKWLDNEKIDWKDMYMVSVSDKAKEWLPPYRYKHYLIGRIKRNELSLDTANLYISHVRQLYEWAWQTKRIEKLPFNYVDKVIKRKKSNTDFDLIFSSLDYSRGIVVQTSDLIIPKKNKQKKMIFNDGLSPYNKEELERFYSTEYMQTESRKLWADLSLLCGLRAVEVTLLNETEIIDTYLDETTVYSVRILGKFNKYREILVPRSFMARLWCYKNSPERLRRSSKWDSKHSLSNKPLFINRSGDRLNEGSITNITSISATELLNRKFYLERSFHDLRSTFATYLARFLLEQDLPLGFIQYKLMSLMGHTNFSTTEKYINFARTTTYDKRMKSWVDDVFRDLEKELNVK